MTRTGAPQVSALTGARSGRWQAIVVKEKAEKADIFAEEIGREKTRVNTEVGWGRWWQGPRQNGDLGN